MAPKVKTCKRINCFFISVSCIMLMMYFYQQSQQYTPGIAESDDAMFIYHEVISRLHDGWNQAAITKLRDEILQAEMTDSARYFIVTKQNSPLHTTLYHYLSKGIKTYTSVNEVLWSKLPKKSPLADKHFKRCSLVGNGGILLESGCGKEIDKADFVFRCNLAPVKNFEEDAGSKTNFTTMNPTLISESYNYLETENDVKNLLKDLREHHGLLWLPCFSYFKAAYSCQALLPKYTVADPQLVIGHPDHYQSVSSFWRSRGQSQRLSTGFYLLSTALQMCDQIHLFGFWPFDFVIDHHGSKFTPYHYYNNITKSSYHVFTKEFHSLLSLHLQGVLRLHPHKCADTPT